jgi:GTP-binding protein EngB required for normal cell division
MKYRLILIEHTIKENSKMMKLFDQINLHYDIIVNKFDLVDEEEQTPFREQIRREVKTLELKQLNSILFLSVKYPQRFPDWITLVNYLTSSVY